MRELIGADEPTVFATEARRDAEASADGPFPLILFSHGLGGFRQQSSFLTTHLASWGFVVAAPEHAERNLATVLSNGELRDDAVPQLRRALNALEANASLVDAARIGLMGHSAGGGAIAALVDAEDFDARGWVSLASIAAPSSEVSGLVLGGESDRIAVPETVARTFDDIEHDDKRYISIADAGHLAFSDICLIGRERGGVLQIAQDSGVEISRLVVTLATDGCRADNLPAEEAWPVIRHFATATFRSALLADPTGLNQPASACFDDLITTDRSSR